MKRNSPLVGGGGTNPIYSWVEDDQSHHARLFPVELVAKHFEGMVCPEYQTFVGPLAVFPFVVKVAWRTCDGNDEHIPVQQVSVVEFLAFQGFLP